MALAAGCAASGKTVTRTILNDKYSVVTLETWLDSARQPVATGFDHPADISEADMARLLESVRIVEPPGFLATVILKARPTPAPAFTAKEAEAFAKPLAAALMKATPNERVVFFLHHQRTVFKGATSTGVLFVKNKRLNLVIGRYLIGNQPGKPDIPLSSEPVPLNQDQDYYIEPGPFHTLTENEKIPGGNEIMASKRWVSIDYTGLLNAPPEAATAAVSQPAPAAGDIPASLTLEEKLKTLKKLKEEGLISEEEFNQKKQDLLKEF